MRDWLRQLRRPVPGKVSRLGDLPWRQMWGDARVSRSSAVQVHAAQAKRRQEEPPARGRMAARYIGCVGVYLREFDLSTRQALLGRGQQPFHCLRPVPDNGVDDNGYAVQGNRPQAVRWLLAAAEQGLPRAQIKLAEVYADGPDIRGSHTTACGWFLLAAMGLHGVHLHDARSGYERIASHLTPAQIAEARRFARDWTQRRSKEAADPGAPGIPDGGGAL